MTREEKTRLRLWALKHVIDTITEDEAVDVITYEMFNAAEQEKVDPYDFKGVAFSDLLGGVVVSILPAGDEEGLEFAVYSPGEFLTFINGWADFCHANRDDETFDIMRIDIMKQGRLSRQVFRAFCEGLMKIVRQRAQAELTRRREEALE